MSTASKTLAPAAAAPPTSGAVRVLHAGPAAGSLGGMSSVIEELCATAVPGLRASRAATWLPGSAVRSALATLALLARLPRLRRSVDVVHVHLSERGSFVREGAVVVAARALGFVVATTLHGADFVEFAEQHPRVVGAVLRRAHVVFALGSRSRSVARSFGVRRAVVLRNPVADAARPGPRSASPNVVYAGVVGRRKGFDVLAAAWPGVRSAVPDAALHVAGPATDIDPAAFAALPGVILHGPLSRDAVGAVLDDAAVACLPSRREALPMFVLEALARGVPVVTSDAGELPDLSDCAAVQVLPNPIDPAMLSERLVASLRAPGGRDAAYDWVSANAFASRVAAAMLVEYRTAIAARGRTGTA